MTTDAFRVQQIDHVEVFVPDQEVAAAWYQQALGLRVLEHYRHWAATGPLMLSSDGGSTMLALFRGEPRGQRPTAGHHRVAFRVDAAGFLAFADHVPAAALYTDDGEPLLHARIIDHDMAWSIYFCDPYGNRYEVTTYDYQAVADTLQAAP